MKGAIVLGFFAALAVAHPADYKPAPTTTKSCTLTICADYINSCGLGYGGCYPACPGYTTPSFSIPPCPSTTTTKTRKTTTNITKVPTTAKPTKTTAAPCQTICVDAVNECGIKYGGCYCRTLTPPYTKPPCPTKTTTTPAPTATGGPKYCGGLLGYQCDKGQICIDDPKSPCGIAVDCLGICVTGEFCGGFANFQCSKKGDVCIDDPRDDCSVKTGGADCGGLCVPKAWV